MTLDKYFRQCVGIDISKDKFTACLYMYDMASDAGCCTESIDFPNSRTGFNQMVKAAAGDPQKAVLMLIADKLPELVKTQVEAVKGINIDKVTVWDTGNGTDGKTATSNFISGMMKSVPPLEDLFKMAGMELPSYLKGGEKTPENQ